MNNTRSNSRRKPSTPTLPPAAGIARVVAAIAIFLASAIARAAAPLAYDGNGILLGAYLGHDSAGNRVIISPAGYEYRILSFYASSPEQLVANTNFGAQTQEGLLYETVSCTGQAYLDAGLEEFGGGFVTSIGAPILNVLAYSPKGAEIVRNLQFGSYFNGTTCTTKIFNVALTVRAYLNDPQVTGVDSNEVPYPITIELGSTSIFYDGFEFPAAAATS
jgi:hypothetical protein